MKVVNINQWGRYGVLITGTVAGHQKFNTGEKVITSRVVKYDGARDVFITKSGTAYRLGEAAPDVDSALNKLILMQHANASMIQEVAHV